MGTRAQGTAAHDLAGEDGTCKGTQHRAALTAWMGVYELQAVTADNGQATNTGALVVQAPSAAQFPGMSQPKQPVNTLWWESF